MAILANPMHPGEKAERQASLSAAEQLGLEVIPTEFDPAQGFEAALDKIRQQRCDALVVFPDTGMLARAGQIAEFGLKERLMCVGLDRVCARRLHCQLRAEPAPGLPPVGALCRSHPEGRTSVEPAGGVAHACGDGAQPENGQGDRHHDAAVAATACG